MLGPLHRGLPFPCPHSLADSDPADTPEAPDSASSHGPLPSPTSPLPLVPAEARAVASSAPAVASGRALALPGDQGTCLSPSGAGGAPLTATGADRRADRGASGHGQGPRRGHRSGGRAGGFRGAGLRELSVSWPHPPPECRLRRREGSPGAASRDAAVLLLVPSAREGGSRLC